MKVGVIWRQNDDVALELYEDLYEKETIYKDELVRVYETKAHYVFIDETNPCGGHLLYVEKNVPLQLAIIAVERVLFEELTLNIEGEQEKKEILEDLAIPNKVKKAIEHTKIVREEPDYNEDVTLIEVHVPAIIVKEVLEWQKHPNG